MLTNDDGFGAAGIVALENVLAAEHEVYVIAPESERSGSSNAFTVHEKLTLVKIDSCHYTISGYPADCVNVGLKAGIVPDVDCVVSGINIGPNLGYDVFFSGTVGAARMGYVCGKPSFAVSIDTRDTASPYIKDAADWFAEFFAMQRFDEPCLININYPNIAAPEGLEYATLARRNYTDRYAATETANGMSLVIEGEPAEANLRNGEDAGAIARGFIAITPLTTDCCDHVALNKLRSERRG